MSKKPTKRLRIFAGPNGSGKSTLVKSLRKDKIVSIKVFVNADEIESEYNVKGFVSLYRYYRFKSTTNELREFIKESSMTINLFKDIDSSTFFKIIKNKIYYSDKFNSYTAADLAAFIRKQLLKRGKPFSFETVFSHESKLEVMKEAKSLGYRVYYYYLTTDDPDLNINRVKIRVAQNGHPVPDDKIIDRYYKSLELLFDAVKLSDRAYLFDTSGDYSKFIAEITKGKKVVMSENYMAVPGWFVQYLYDKIPRLLKA